jgi:hypothetical protein
MARRQRRVGVAMERHYYLQLVIENFDVGPHGNIGLLPARTLDLLGYASLPNRGHVA